MKVAPFSGRLIFSTTVLLVVFLAAIFAPLISPHNPYSQDLLGRLKPPGTHLSDGGIFLLGTDALGRDVLSRIIYGTRVSIAVALASVVLSGTLGTFVGIVGGYYRHVLGAVLMRTVDIMLSIPFLLFAIAIVAVLGPGFTHTILVLVLTRWARYARVAYGQALSLQEAEYVEAARALGASDWRVMLRHVFPGILPALLVVATLEVGFMILFEAALSFLGLGVQPPTPSWGAMVSEGKNYLATAWWLATFPGLAIILVVLSINLIGDTLQKRFGIRSS